MNFLEKSSGIVYTTEALIPKGLPVTHLDIMRKAGYFPIEYQHQNVIDKWTQKEQSLALEFNEMDNTYYQRYELVSLDEKTLQKNLQYLKDKAIEAINDNTSNKILQGFYYPLSVQDGEEATLVFISYNEFDQINFINTSYQFQTGQVQTVNWKSYTDNSKKEMTVITLNSNQFFNLYNFALNTKDGLLSQGEELKANIKSLQSIPELRLFCANYNIELPPLNNIQQSLQPV